MNDEVEVVDGPIQSITVFPNGMVVVFNTKGEQMPQLQGYFKEKEAVICEWIGKQEKLPRIRS